VRTAARRRITGVGSLGGASSSSYGYSSLAVALPSSGGVRFRGSRLAPVFDLAKTTDSRSILQLDGQDSTGELACWGA